MIRASLLATLALLLLGCPPPTLLRDTKSGYTVRKSDGNKMAGGRAGELHPAVIEYVLASEDAPFALYYQLALEQGSFAGDLGQLATAAAELAPAGQPANGVHYARARARALAPAINKGLVLATDRHNGAVDITCCAPVSAENRSFMGRGFIFASLMVNHLSKVVRLHWADARVTRTLTWDLSELPAAHDANATLDYETVTQKIRAMHGPQPPYAIQ